MAYRNSNHRGYARPRGGYSRTAPSTAGLPPDRDIMDGLNAKLVETISLPMASSRAQAFTGTLIDNAEYVASYNWTDREEPTIIVPGSPPVWNNRRTPFTLTPDARIQFVDQNGYRMKDSSGFQPLFAAIDTIGTTVDWPTLDIVTDRNALRKLMRWIAGNASKDFRIDLELLGENTILLHRWEKRYREVPKYETFGFSFEEETTNAAPDCGASTGHYRAIRYDYFGLKMLVRFEVDACLTAAPATAAHKKTSLTSTRHVDDLLGALDRLGVQSSAQAKQSSPRLHGVKVTKGGAEVPQEALLELTTRSQRNADQFDWTEALPQLYLSSTPHLYLGVHQRGTFAEIRKHNLNKEDLVTQRREAAESYDKLGRVLEAIQGLVLEHGPDAGLSLVCARGQLQVYKRTSLSRLLPDDIRARFDS